MREIVPPSYYLPKTRQFTYETYARVMGLLWKDPAAQRRLSPNQHQVIYRRFLSPLPQDAIPTLQQVATEMKITRQRVSQLEHAALKRLEAEDA